MSQNQYISRCVEKFGVDRVWHGGLKALGYPPSWAHTWKEGSLVFDFLSPDRREEDEL